MYKNPLYESKEETTYDHRGREFPVLATVEYCGHEFVDACHEDNMIACRVIADSDDKAEAAMGTLARNGYNISRSNDPESARIFRTPALDLLGFIQLDGMKFGTSRDNDVCTMKIPDLG